MPRVIALLVVLCGIASAQSPSRVIVADSDPELRQAIVKSLRPWKIEVVLDTMPPADAAEAAARGNARYVVWRDGAELVVFDRDTNQAERRPATAGTLDHLGAAAAALSVKTMLRLPPEPPPQIVTPVQVTPTTDDGTELRVEAGTGARAEYGLDGNVALRFSAAAEIRPWADMGWRFGAFGDLGSAASVDQSGFHGEWTNWSILATTSWSRPVGDFEVGPWLGIGIEHSSLTGAENDGSRNEEAFLLALRGGVTARYPLSAGWAVGSRLSLETVPGTRTYTKLQGSAEVFEIPPIGVQLAVVISCDFSDNAAH